MALRCLIMFSAEDYTQRASFELAALASSSRRCLFSVDRCLWVFIQFAEQRFLFFVRRIVRTHADNRAR